MPRKPRQQYAGAKYYITARGSGDKAIFDRDEDRRRFLSQLEYALNTDEVVLYAYAIMRNHYHLLVETPRANIGEFEHRLNTAYSVYYRFRRKWRGHVMQCRYGGKLVHGDAYLLAMTRYIHLNPVKTVEMRKAPAAERRSYLRKYQWSSYRGYIQKQHEEEMVNYRCRELSGVATDSARRTAYGKYVEGFINKDDDKTLTALEVSPYAIGNRRFVAEIESELNEQKATAGSRAAIVRPKTARPVVGTMEREVAKAFGIKSKDLGAHARRVGRAKSVAVELACRLCGLTQRAAGERYGGICCAAVGHLRRNLRLALTEDPELQQRMRDLEAALKSASPKRKR